MKQAVLRLAALVTCAGFLVGCSTVSEEPGADSARYPTAWSSPADARAPATGSDDVLERTPYVTAPQPASIRIPALGVMARIQPVGLTDPSTMQVPKDISVVGWFDQSVTPRGESGHTVLVGHRDGTTDPNGVFRYLADVNDGDRIVVRDLAGTRTDYTVMTVEALGRKAFARHAPAIFATDGPHQLVLLTCGGNYDLERGGYDKTVVVFAKRT